MIHHHISCFPPVLRITVAEALGKGVAGDLELGDLKQILFKPIISRMYGKCKLCQFEAFCAPPTAIHTTEMMMHMYIEYNPSLMCFWNSTPKSKSGDGGQSCFSILSGVNLPYRLQIWLIRCKWVLHQAQTQNTPNLWICPRI